MKHSAQAARDRLRNSLLAVHVAATTPGARLVLPTPPLPALVCGLLWTVIAALFWLIVALTLSLFHG